ncbi:hypothetical protein [Enterococcus sp. AZ109]|uniref:hypothetical protein n=1 Tax=Enterococcus sp. AZ109 TaxID=2774634 RepID=UPI003F29E576
MAKGAFQTSREIFENPIWTDVVKFRIFFYIYGNAVFANDGTTVADVHLKRGQFLRSYRNLQNDLAYKEKRGYKQYSLNTIKKKIDQLVKEGRIEIEVTDYGTLFTVVNYEEYQGFGRYENPISERQKNDKRTQSERQENNNKNDKNDKNDKNNNNTSKKPKKRVYSDDDPNKKLAKILYQKILENINIKEPDFNSWANVIRLTIEADKRSGKDVQDMIIWATQHEFWSGVIQSPVSLRKHFDKMLVQKNKKSSKSVPDSELPDTGLDW